MLSFKLPTFISDVALMTLGKYSCQFFHLFPFDLKAFMTFDLYNAVNNLMQSCVFSRRVTVFLCISFSIYFANKVSIKYSLTEHLIHMYICICINQSTEIHVLPIQACQYLVNMVALSGFGQLYRGFSKLSQSHMCLLVFDWYLKNTTFR